MTDPTQGCGLMLMISLKDRTSVSSLSLISPIQAFRTLPPLKWKIINRKYFFCCDDDDDDDAFKIKSTVNLTDDKNYWNFLSD